MCCSMQVFIILKKKYARIPHIFSYRIFFQNNKFLSYCSLHIILLNPTIKMRFWKSRLINYRDHNVFQTTLLNVSFNYDWRYLNSLIQGEIFFLLYIRFFLPGYGSIIALVVWHTTRILLGKTVFSD